MENILIYDNSLNVDDYKNLYKECLENLVTMFKPMIVSYNEEWEIRDRLSVDCVKKCAMFNNIPSILHRLEKFYTKTQKKKPVVFILCSNDESTKNHQMSFLKIQICRAKGWKFVLICSNEKGMVWGNLLGVPTISYIPNKEGFEDIINILSDTFLDIDELRIN